MMSQPIRQYRRSRRQNRKGQAAIEFLMTYGWAFIVLLTMIGAVSYFGITKTSSFIPESCQFSSDIACQDFQIVTADDDSKSMVMVTLRQTLGKSAYLQNIVCEDLSFGAASTGWYHAEGNPVLSETYGFSYPVGGKGGLTTDQVQWDPSETVTLKCAFSADPYADLVDEKVRVPITITLQKRLDGFDHIVQGEVVASVRSTS